MTFPRGFPRRGEIYWAPLDKVRPVLIVSAEQGNKFSDSVVVAALTSRIPEKAYPVNVALAGGDPLPDRGLVLCRSLFTLPKEKLESFRANLRPEQMAQVDRALSIALALPRPPPAEWPPPAE